MAEKETAVKGSQMTDVLGAMVDTLRGISEDSKRDRKKNVNEVLVKTPWDPEGSLGGIRKLQLKWEHVYMNGSRITPELLHDEEIELLNQLKKSGRYNKGKWGVSVRKHDRTVDISYYNKSVEQRLELTRDAGNLAGMIRKILIEQEARDNARKRGEDYDED